MKRFTLLTALAVLCCHMAVTVYANDALSRPVLDHNIEAVGLTGNTWYVSARGRSNATGTQDDPFDTIQAAADRVEPGDTVLIRSGVYRNSEEYAAVDIKRGGTAENWVRFANYPGERPKIEFDSLRGIKLSGVGYVVVEGLHIDGLSYRINPDEAVAHAERFTGEDFSQHRFFGVGIRVGTGDAGEFPHHIILRNNYIHHTAGGGIASARADYLLIEDNIIHDTSFYSPWGESGISVWMSADYDKDDSVYRTVIQNNISYRNDNKVDFWIMNTMSDGNGIILDAMESTQQNIVNDGFLEPYSGRVLVANNVSFYNGGRGINVFESDDIDIINNTLFENAQRENIRNEIEFGRTRRSRAFNNIISSREDAYAFGGYEYEDVTTDYNLIFNSRSTGFGGASFDVIAEPDFVAPPRSPEDDIKLYQIDFRLAPYSAAIEAGNPAVTTRRDKSGAVRVGEIPDLGSYDFTGVKELKIVTETEAEPALVTLFDDESLVLSIDDLPRTTVIRPGTQNRIYHSVFPVSGMVLDGRLDESIWSEVPWEAVEAMDAINYRDEPVGNEDSSYAFAAVANSDYIYVAVKVLDDVESPMEDGGTWYLDDSIEIYVGPHVRESSYGPRDSQFGITRKNEYAGGGFSAFRAGVQSVVVNGSNGWLVEARIPLEQYDFVVEDGSQIAFNVHLNDDDAVQPGTRDHKLIWSELDTEDTSWRSSEVWGTLQFVEIRTE